MIMNANRKILTGAAGALAIGGLVLTGCSQGAQNTEPVENSAGQTAAASCTFAPDSDLDQALVGGPPEVAALVAQMRAVPGVDDTAIATGFSFAAKNANLPPREVGISLYEGANDAAKLDPQSDPSIRLNELVLRSANPDTLAALQTFVKAHQSGNPCPASVTGQPQPAPSQPSSVADDPADDPAATGASTSSAPSTVPGQTAAQATERLVVKVKGAKKSKVVVKDTSTTEKGRYKVEGHKLKLDVAPGAYKVKAKKSGYAKAKKKVTVDDAQSKTEVKLKLTPQ